MKVKFSPELLPRLSALLTCASHEPRCEGLTSRMGNWRPDEAIVFHYDDINRKREERHNSIIQTLTTVGVSPKTLIFTESNTIKSLHDNMGVLTDVLSSQSIESIVLDISTFTKRHLLMILRWLDDERLWDKLCIIYSEPEEYIVSQYIPLSYGLSSIQQIPGYSACPDFSRPLHLVLFLGYEGDRALALYEHIQPMYTTLIIPSPPFRSSWSGRTERFNEDLLKIVGNTCTKNVDPIDPEATEYSLIKILGDGNKRSHQAKVICPLGTKPQTVGIYLYVRRCIDPPAIIYASPLMHNHEFFSYGIGKTWILKQPK